MKRNKRIFGILAIFVLLIASFGVYSQYQNIENAHFKKNVLPNVEAYTKSVVTQNGFVIANELDAKAGTNTPIADKYLNFKGNDKESKEEKNALKEIMGGWKYELNDEKNLHYYAVNTVTGESVFRGNIEDLTKIMNDTQVQKAYSVFARVTYDGEGNVSVEKAGSNWENALKRTDWYPTVEQDTYGEQNDIYLSNPKNVTIVYAVPKITKGHSILAMPEYENGYLSYFVYLLPYIVIGSIFVALFMFVAPFRVSSETKLLKHFTHFKIEPLLLIIGGLLFYSIFILSYMLYQTVSGELFLNLAALGLNDISEFIEVSLNASVWLLFFMLIMLIVFLIKNLFNKGLKRFFLENTCLYFIIQNVKRLLVFDFRNKTNITVMKYIVVNMFFLILIALMDFESALVATFLYTIFLFVFLKRKLDKIKDDYNILLDATKQLSEGDFSVELENDLGAFQALKDEFFNIKNGFEKAVNEEVKSQQLKTELVSNVSHDLKTPLTSIITYVDLLRDEKLNDELRAEYTETLERNAFRLKHLIDDLFEVSKATSGNIQLDLIEVDIVALLKQVEFECQDKIKHRNLEFKLNFSNEKIPCLLDASKTYRIFENLILNICKYSLPHTRVYIDVLELEDIVRISLKNISEHEIAVSEENIVERFVRGDASRNTEGSGLGLAIAKSFVDLQEGSFAVEIEADLFKVIIQFKK